VEKEAQEIEGRIPGLYQGTIRSLVKGVEAHFSDELLDPVSAENVEEKRSRPK